jgi:CRP-like cAMP-binding protein
MDLERSGGRLLRFDEGDVVFDEGDEGDTLYIVLEGGVRIRKAGDFYTTVLAECGPGEMFGELALIDTQPHSASAVASDASSQHDGPTPADLRRIRPRQGGDDADPESGP